MANEERFFMKKEPKLPEKQLITMHSDIEESEFYLEDEMSFTELSKWMEALMKETGLSSDEIHIDLEDDEICAYWKKMESDTSFAQRMKDYEKEKAIWDKWNKKNEKKIKFFLKTDLMGNLERATDSIAHAKYTLEQGEKRKVEILKRLENLER